MRLKQIREELKYSLEDMAQIIGTKKGTYQGYEIGRRTTPPHILQAAELVLQRDREFMQRYVPGGAFDQIIMEEYPLGIVSAPMECNW